MNPSHKPVSDSHLVKQLAQKNEQAFQVIFEKYRDDIYTYSKALLQSNEAAEEIVQEVFLRLWQNAAQLDHKLNLKSFLFTICRNLSFDTLRKLATSRKLNQALLYSRDTSHNQVLGSILDDEYEEIRLSAIEKLPPKRKLIFQMSREREMSYEEISKELGISISTVKSQMNKALQHMRSQLEGKTDLILTLALYLGLTTY